jgi:hypothetical protein
VDHGRNPAEVVILSIPAIIAARRLRDRDIIEYFDEDPDHPEIVSSGVDVERGQPSVGLGPF